MGVVGQGVAEGFLDPADVARVVRDGLAVLPVDGKRVVVLIPDGTRTMPMPLMFESIERELGPRTAALDYLVALGTHSPMDDAALSRLVGRPVVNGTCGRSRIFNHRWDDPATFAHLGTIPAREIAEITGGRLDQDVPVALNKLVVEYDHVLICGPVFPHEVVGFSGGTKYLFPGIAAAPNHPFHPLARRADHQFRCDWHGRYAGARGHQSRGLVPRHAAVAAGARRDARRHCRRVLRRRPRSVASGGTPLVRAAISSGWIVRSIGCSRSCRRCTTICGPRPRARTRAEPAVADGGEVVVFAPHVREVSYVHGRLIDEIGYHCRDYFLAQWDRFAGYPGGILAHSTHVKGLGTFDARRRVESPRITVTLATGISRRALRAHQPRLSESCGASTSTSWSTDNAQASRMVPRAGELLFRVGKPPAVSEIPTLKYAMGVVGLGVMGANLARNAESQGFPVAGYDLDAQKAAAFVAGRRPGQAVDDGRHVRRR